MYRMFAVWSLAHMFELSLYLSCIFLFARALGTRNIGHNGNLTYAIDNHFSLFQFIR